MEWKTCRVRCSLNIVSVWSFVLFLVLIGELSTSNILKLYDDFFLDLGSLVHCVALLATCTCFCYKNHDRNNNSVVDSVFTDTWIPISLDKISDLISDNSGLKSGFCFEFCHKILV